ncbi:hypothetical protein [Plantibacter sp. YIM 135347]|uniref:hypothetical protein n=1 Tax=Plantibacter sp. YIM 135347 TaxID=3423919 RepID=UPI003D324F48
MAINIKKLTLGEMAKVEELSGLSIDSISDSASPKGLLLAALAFVAKKRTNPEYTWNEAQALTAEDVAELGLTGDDAEGEGEAPKAPQKK